MASQRRAEAYRRKARVAPRTPSILFGKGDEGGQKEASNRVPKKRERRGQWARASHDTRYCSHADEESVFAQGTRKPRSVWSARGYESVTRPDRATREEPPLVRAVRNGFPSLKGSSHTNTRDHGIQKRKGRGDRGAKKLRVRPTSDSPIKTSRSRPVNASRIPLSSWHFRESAKRHLLNL